MEPILEKKCWGNMLDIVCNDALRKCRRVPRTIDCKIPSSACFAKNQLKLVQKAIKCANDNCDLCAPVQQEPASCRGPDKECSDNTISTTIEAIQLFNTKIKNFLKKHLGDQQTADLVQVIFDRILYNFKQANDLELNGEKESKELEECTSWTIDLNNTQIENQQVYCSNDVDTDITSKWNSGLMLTCILLYYTCVVMVLAKDYQKFRCSFKLNCSVRFGCLIIGIMMSLLMYIGSFHLKNGNATVWQVLYLLVSYTCMHGALLVIVPSNAKINVTERINEVDESICCFIKNGSMFLGFKEQFWDASGEFFWLKLVLMEIFEMTLQVQSLATSAAKSQVNDVALSAGIIAANFVVLPLVIILTPKIFASHHAVIAAIMIVEVFFDKLYVGVGVILRSDTLIQPNQSFMEQLTVHAALLLPAIMTALDVQDMLTLSFYTESVLTKSKMMHKSRKSHKIQKQNSIIVRAANGVDKVVHNSVFVAMERIFLISSILLGLILGLYMAISVTNIHIECLNNIGNIAGCANNKFYFANGLFSSTTCAFDQVTEFNCDQDYALSKILPDAEDKWYMMTNLKLINVSNNKLERAPTGWSTIPRSVTIDFRNSALSDLPFVLCAKQTNLTAIYFEGTAAGKTLNWTGQLLLPTFNTQVINHACLSQLITLQNFNTLLLSHNSLTEEILEDNDLFVQLSKLQHLDLQHNNFAELISFPMDTVFRPIIQRFVNANKKEEASNKSVSINFAGNPIKEVTIKGEQSLFVGEWVSILNTFTELKNHLKCIGCNIKDVSIIDALVKTKAFQDVLIMDFEKNEINGVKMMTALATGLRTAKVWKLNIVANGLEDIGANILIEVLPQTQIRELNIEGNPKIKYVLSMFHKNNITNVNGYKIKFKSNYNKKFTSDSSLYKYEEPKD